jgi:hypothetical protein
VIVDELVVSEAPACGDGRHRRRDGDSDFKVEDKFDTLWYTSPKYAGHRITAVDHQLTKALLRQTPNGKSSTNAGKASSFVNYKLYIRH